MNLARTNTVLAIQDQPDRRKPFVQAQRGIFEDSPDLHGELSLIMADAALPAKLIFQEADILATAGRAGNAIPPLRTTDHEVVKTVDLIREVNDSVFQGLGFVSGFHVFNLTPKPWIRQVYNCPNLTVK